MNSVSYSQTILSAGPTAVIQGNILSITVSTNTAVSNLNNFKLVNGSTTIYPSSTSTISANNYLLNFFTREYESTGNYTLMYSTYSYSTPIVIYPKNYSEIFNYNSVSSLNINVSDTYKDGINKIAIDSQGNKYCVGSFSGTATFGSQNLISAGARDCFIAKYNSTGVLKWIKTIGSSIDDFGSVFESMTSVELFNDTIVYVTGYVQCHNSLKFNNTTNLNFPFRNVNSQDGILMKLDTAGNYKWHSMQGTIKRDATNDLEIDEFGNIFLTGSLQGDMSISQFSNDTCASFVYSADLTDSIRLKSLRNDENSVYIAKYSNNGSVLWAKKQDRDIFTTGGRPVDIKFFSDGSLIILIWSSGAVTYDNITCSNGSCCNNHFALLKIDSLGNRQWCKEVGNHSKVFSMGIDQNDNIYLPRSYYTSNDAVQLQKFDQNGNQVWLKSLNNTADNGGNYFSVTDKFGNTYVSLSYRDNYNGMYYSMILKKFDANGNVMAITYPTPYNANIYNAPTAIALNSTEDKIYFAGNYRNTQTFGGTNMNSSTTKVYFNEINTNANPNALDALLLINSSDADNFICDGTSVTFTANPINGGSNPSYQWKLNGINVGTNSSTYTNSNLSNGDILTCEMLSDLPGVTNNPVTSAAVTMSVNTNTPSISISTPNTNICVGSAVTFNATSVNGGTPTYQWKKNGANVGTNSPTYITSCNNGDIINCVMTSNAQCLTSSTATSNSLTMNINPLIPFSVTISTPANPFCAGDLVTFTATHINGGSSPSYSWYKNGSPVGVYTSTYSSINIYNGTSIRCIMTADTLCASPSSANSNLLTMSEIDVTTPIITQNGMTLTSDAFSGNQWYLDGNLLVGETNQTIQVTSSGVYTVIVENGGCYSEPSNSISINFNDLNDLENNISLNVFPNPNNGNFNITLFSKNKENIKIELYNGLGQIILTEQLLNNIGKNTLQFDLGENAKGFYTLQIYNDLGVVVKKIIIQ
jgi:hypothetical protein